jgi:hypothetical protein
VNGDPEGVRDAIEQPEPVETAIVPEDTPSSAATSTASPDGDFVVEIPGRRPGERTLLAVPDQQTADELRHLVNAFRRGEALAREREALGRWREELGSLRKPSASIPTVRAASRHSWPTTSAAMRRRGRYHAPATSATTPTAPRRVTARRVGNMRY